MITENDHDSTSKTEPSDITVSKRNKPGILKRAFNGMMSMILTTYTKRKIVLSSLVGYFLKIDALDMPNITRINKLMRICDYSAEAMKLPILLSDNIWKGVDVPHVNELDTVGALTYLKENIPECLLYPEIDEDIKMFLGKMRNKSFNFIAAAK